eukprot:CAMPEP_0168318612 /NCGR_PEP_ID=MMETSP0213-20121227/580_1 /TAXON_ID=151035 /ORGANISM="Euplotes harpa, Strain FSP1.4" /LENGTH=113 /DNA_ID=CAMNT_0008319707 /DNA_START=72 /DNA_END=414 /DNA_ORIENTATION=-
MPDRAVVVELVQPVQSVEFSDQQPGEAEGRVCIKQRYLQYSRRRSWDCAGVSSSKDWAWENKEQGNDRDRKGLRMGAGERRGLRRAGESVRVIQERIEVVMFLRRIKGRDWEV